MEGEEDEEEKAAEGFFQVCNLLKQEVLAGASLLTNGRME